MNTLLKSGLVAAVLTASAIGMSSGCDRRETVGYSHTEYSQGRRGYQAREHRSYSIERERRGHSGRDRKVEVKIQSGGRHDNNYRRGR